jgi:hypothetical protein
MNETKLTIEPFFDFSFKSEVLTAKNAEHTCCLCLSFFDNVFDSDELKTKITFFVKSYNYTTDIVNGVVNYLVVILPDTAEASSFSKAGIIGIDLQRFSFLTSIAPPLFIHYDSEGRWKTDYPLTETELVKLKAEIKTKGLYQIFEKGSGILESGPGHHYVLQNNFHADKFIRTANILTNSSYVNFLAIFLLDFIRNEDDSLYIDTSGIIGLAYAIGNLKKIFVQRFSLSITSFNSYDGIRNLIVDRSKRILISASTSAKLSALLIKQGFAKENICVLFYLNTATPEVNVLCNLIDFKKLNHTEKYSPFNIQSESECSFCRDNSYPIKIVGEQFLPEELKVDVFSLDLTNRPLWLTKFISQYFNHEGIIKCFFRSPSSRTKRDLFLDFKNIIALRESTKLGDKLERLFASKLPNQIDILIHYGDEGSLALKDLVCSKYYNVDTISALDDNDLNSNLSLLKNKNVLIVSSTIISGRRLVETSLKLRDSKCKGICYFVAMSRTPDEATTNTTRRYIGFDNKYGGDINPLVVAEAIYLPDTTRATTFSDPYSSPWEAEIKLLINDIPHQCFKSRLTDLQKDIGLINNLFWTNALGKRLGLRENFAFYSGISTISNSTITASKTTQAEVFFVINSILHNLRAGGGRKIFQSAFRRNVISPETFISYNDGVIQASILRSANPIELNYSFLGNNTRTGNEMINVLKYIFGNFNNEIGEATIEFLVAISTRRMQLINKELVKIIDTLMVNANQTTTKNKEQVMQLCQFIKTTICHGAS